MGKSVEKEGTVYHQKGTKDMVYFCQKNIEKGGATVKYNVGDIRYKKGVSLRKLAEQARISRSYLQKIEAGEARPSLEIMVRLARVLESPLDKLYQVE